MQITSLPNLPELSLETFEGDPLHYLMSSEPFVVRRLAAQWPLYSCVSTDIDFLHLLSNCAAETTLPYFELPPSAKGRIFYNSDFSGFNFSQSRDVFHVFAKKLIDRDTCCYLGSTPVSHAFPTLFSMINAPWAPTDSIVNLWIGNACSVGAHYDVLQNLAVNVTGQRTFTLFPPESIVNLYPGPIHRAPGGQAISLVDFADIDEKQYPRFKNALDSAMTATLSEGDAIFIPSLWWHHVQGKKRINTLLNFWYKHKETPSQQLRPMDALSYCIAAVRDLPKAQRKGWLDIFKYYVFEHDSADTEHIPISARERLTSPLPNDIQKKIRAQMTNNLKR